MELIEALPGDCCRSQFHDALVHWLNLTADDRRAAKLRPRNPAAALANGCERIDDKNWYIHVEKERFFLSDDSGPRELPYVIRDLGGVGSIHISAEVPIVHRPHVLACALAEVRGEATPPPPPALRKAA
jgi:hypothetical protein